MFGGMRFALVDFRAAKQRRSGGAPALDRAKIRFGALHAEADRQAGGTPLERGGRSIQHEGSKGVRRKQRLARALK